MLLTMLILSVNALVPKSALYSYPSEDATVAGVVGEMMKLLFPGDQDFIQQKMEEHKRARLMAGANVRSDIEAGEALGKAVAHKIYCKGERRQGWGSSRQPGFMGSAKN